MAHGPHVLVVLVLILARQEVGLLRQDALEVEGAYRQVVDAVRATIGEIGPDLDGDRHRHAGVPGFILRA